MLLLVLYKNEAYIKLSQENPDKLKDEITESHLHLSEQVSERSEEFIDSVTSSYIKLFYDDFYSQSSCSSETALIQLNEELDKAVEKLCTPYKFRHEKGDLLSTLVEDKKDSLTKLTKIRAVAIFRNNPYHFYHFRFYPSAIKEQKDAVQQPIMELKK